MRADRSASDGSRVAFLNTIAGALILAAASACGTVRADPFSDLRVARPHVSVLAPRFALRNLAGGRRTLADYRGHVVLLNFWATFCGPCRREMPALEKAWRRYAKQGLVVLAVAEDPEGKAVVAPYLRRYPYTFPVLLDPDGKIRHRYEVNVLPVTYLIGADGRILGRAIGARDWAGPAGQALLTALTSGHRQ